MGPLNGYTVLELAGIGPAPMGGMILADMGAEVIRIDRAASAPGLHMKDVSTRGKKSVALNLKDPAGLDTLLRMVETTAGLGVSCIVEYVIRRSRPDDWARLTAAADCVVLLTTCRDAMSRFTDREMNDALVNRRPVLEALGHASIEDHTRRAVSRMESVVDDMRTDFDVPMLQVATDQGYQPSLVQLIEFIGGDQRTR